MEYILIEDHESLQTMIAQCEETEELAIDTEFIRQRTYYPILGLFQLYNGVNTYLIDPLAIDDLSTLWALLDKRSVILHASSEDLDVFETVAGKIPDAFHDSQIAAAFAGLGPSMGFAGLVAHYLELELDKGASRSNWLLRPLSQTQLTYAAADVFYLLPCWSRLEKKLKELGYYEFYLQEVNNLRDKKSQKKQPSLVYKQFKNVSLLNQKQLATLQALGEWRELQAIERDMAVNFVVKEAHLFEVAKSQPSSMFELNKLGLFPVEIKRHGKRLLQIVKMVNNADEANFPDLITRISDYPDYKKTVQKIKVKIAEVSEQKAIPAELIGSKKLINELLNWVWKKQDILGEENNKPLLLKNWRAEVVGHDLLALIKQ